MTCYTNHMPDELLSPEYQNLTQTSVPEVDLSFLEPLLWTSAILTIVFAFIFLLYATYNIIRRYKVEKATLEMRDDIRRMRELMEKGSAATPITHPASHTQPTPQQPIAAPEKI